MNLWVTPLCGVAFLGLAWLIGRVVIVSSFVIGSLSSCWGLPGSPMSSM